MKRLTLTLTDEAADTLQTKVPYRRRGAYVSDLIEKDQGISAAPPETPTLAALLTRIIELETRVADLEGHQPPT